MPQSTDLVGLGMAPDLAGELGHTASTLVCLATSTQTGAAKVLTKNVELTAADSSHNSALLPSTAKVGNIYLFFTSTSTSAIVYVPVGDYLNGSQNAGLTVAQNKGAAMWRYKVSAGVGYWASILTA